MPRFQDWRDKGEWLNEKHLSDGTLRLLGVLWSLLDGKGALRLEEPELSLHKAIIQVFPQLIAKLQTESKYERQILLSTHSADLLADGGIGLHESFILTSSDEGTLVRSARDIPGLVDLLEEGLTLADTLIPETTPLNVNQIPLFTAL
jgi:predicted ATPase